MKLFVAALAVALVLLQYRLWMSEQGWREVSRLESAIRVQADENRVQETRNRELAAEVADLKIGMSALEERARSELGMIGDNETFFQVVSPATAPPAAPPAPVTARTQ